jgi:hypothetical protein
MRYAWAWTLLLSTVITGEYCPLSTNRAAPSDPGDDVYLPTFYSGTPHLGEATRAMRFPASVWI